VSICCFFLLVIPPYSSIPSSKAPESAREWKFLFYGSDTTTDVAELLQEAKYFIFEFYKVFLSQEPHNSTLTEKMQQITASVVARFLPSSEPILQLCKQSTLEILKIAEEPNCNRIQEEVLPLILRSFLLTAYLNLEGQSKGFAVSQCIRLFLLLHKIQVIKPPKNDEYEPFFDALGLSRNTLEKEKRQVLQPPFDRKLQTYAPKLLEELMTVVRTNLFDQEDQERLKVILDGMTGFDFLAWSKHFTDRKNLKAQATVPKTLEKYNQDFKPNGESFLTIIESLKEYKKHNKELANLSLKTLSGPSERATFFKEIPLLHKYYHQFVKEKKSEYALILQQKRNANPYVLLLELSHLNLLSNDLPTRSRRSTLSSKQFQQLPSALSSSFSSSSTSNNQPQHIAYVDGKDHPSAVISDRILIGDGESEHFQSLSVIGFRADMLYILVSNTLKECNDEDVQDSEAEFRSRVPFLVKTFDNPEQYKELRSNLNRSYTSLLPARDFLLSMQNGCGSEHNVRYLRFLHTRKEKREDVENKNRNLCEPFVFDVNQSMILSKQMQDVSGGVWVLPLTPTEMEVKVSGEYVPIVALALRIELQSKKHLLEEVVSRLTKNKHQTFLLSPHILKERVELASAVGVLDLNKHPSLLYCLDPSEWTFEKVFFDKNKKVEEIFKSYWKKKLLINDFEKEADNQNQFMEHAKKMLLHFLSMHYDSTDSLHQTKNCFLVLEGHLRYIRMLLNQFCNHTLGWRHVNSSNIETVCSTLQHKQAPGNPLLHKQSSSKDNATTLPERNQPSSLVRSFKGLQFLVLSIDSDVAPTDLVRILDLASMVSNLRVFLVRTPKVVVSLKMMSSDERLLVKLDGVSFLSRPILGFDDGSDKVVKFALDKPMGAVFQAVSKHVERRLIDSKPDNNLHQVETRNTSDWMKDLYDWIYCPSQMSDNSSPNGSHLLAIVLSPDIEMINHVLEKSVEEELLVFSMRTTTKEQVEVEIAEKEESNTVVLLYSHLLSFTAKRRLLQLVLARGKKLICVEPSFDPRNRRIGLEFVNSKGQKFDVVVHEKMICAQFNHKVMEELPLPRFRVLHYLFGSKVGYEFLQKMSRPVHDEDSGKYNSLVADVHAALRQAGFPLQKDMLETPDVTNFFRSVYSLDLDFERNLLGLVVGMIIFYETETMKQSLLSLWKYSHEDLWHIVLLVSNAVYHVDPRWERDLSFQGYTSDNSYLVFCSQFTRIQAYLCFLNSISADGVNTTSIFCPISKELQMLDLE
jgi:hypothetical protein